MKNSRGFTLLEIMIVMAIIAGVVGLALPKLRKSETNIKGVMRELGALSVEVRHHARLKNSTYRIVFNMTGSEHSYYLEAANHKVLIKSSDRLEREKSLSKEDQPSTPFQKVDKPLKGEKKIPSGLMIKSVETRLTKGPITSGIAYVHYTPEGLAEQAIIQISKGNDFTWSLIINPLTGHADIVDKAVSMKDLEL